MKKTFTLSVCFILLSGTMCGQASYDGFISRSHTYMGTTLPYRLFIPTGYSSAKKYPIVLCLHGSGESGTDNLRQLTYPMATSWADPTNQAKYPCFVVAPQYPDGGTWSLGVSLPIRRNWQRRTISSIPLLGSLQSIRTDSMSPASPTEDSGRGTSSFGFRFSFAEDI